MKKSPQWIRLLMIMSAVLAFAVPARAQQQVQIAGAPCAPLAFLHCPDKDCPPERVINPGPVVELKTRRTKFLDNPSDLNPGEKATFILSLHAFGSEGNCQGHTFPLLDYTAKNRRDMP